MKDLLETNCFDIHLNGQLHLYVSNTIKKENDNL